MIPFTNTPSNLRVPLFFAEVDNSQASTAVPTQRTLIIGQITSAGAATPGVPIICQGIADAANQGGANSMLALMVAAYRAVDPFGELWMLPLADDGAAVAATGTVQFTHAATANGTFYLYIGNTRYAMPVQTTQATTDLATALAALVNADTQSPVTASVSSATVTFTAVNKGVCGNDITIRQNYKGPRAGEYTPAGLTISITQMSSGATNPSLTTPLVALADRTFDFIVSPYNDTTSRTSLSTFMNDSAGRWSPLQQIYGHVFNAQRGSLGALVTAGNAVNDQHLTIFGFNHTPTPNWIWVAAMTAAEAVSRRQDPARPTQTLSVPGIVAPNLQNRFVLSDRNTLLYNGISTFTVDDAGVVHIDNTITTYQKNTFGTPDNSYLEVDTMYTLMAVLRALRGAVTSKYSRVKLAADGTRFAPGSAIVTPSMVKAELVAQYRQLEYQGLVQGTDQFKAGLVVEQNATNPNRLDVLYPAILIDQLRVFATLVQFRLQVS